VITADRTTANLAFGIRLMPLDQQQQVIDTMGRALHPPAGVTARLAGLQVLAAEANASLSSPLRRLGTLLAGLLAVGLVLLLVYRRWERAWVPLVPIALASGWSALVLFVLRVPLNPMSATLGALVIAISTEFSVLLSARYREERAGGLEPRCGGRTRRPAPRWSRRARRRSPASRCSRCRTCTCCRTSGASPSSTSRSRCSACSRCCRRC
jgi:multidrug efflux pump subunit AcrB